MKEKFEAIVMQYVIKFAQKHDTVFIDWVGWEGFGKIAQFYGGYYFNFDDIRLDIDTKQPKGFIFQWHDESTHYTDLVRLPFPSYVAGARFNVLN